MPISKKVDKKKEKSKVKSSDMPKLVDMLEAGVHFGHERSKKNPHMDPYIFMLRNRMAIIDLEKTQIKLTKAVEFIFEIAKDPAKEILFVGTKRQARIIVRKYAEATGMPFVTKRWLGGTLTNFPTVLKSIEKLDDLKKASEDETSEQLTKKERLFRSKEIGRLESVLEGMKSLRKMPDAILVVGAHDERLAVKEAHRSGIPVVGITDTNADPSLVTYPIPANDDAIRSLDLIVKTLAEAIQESRGKKLEVKD